MGKKEKLICVSCKYETDYQGTYKKAPACPHCKNLLSFKDSITDDLEQEVPYLNQVLLALGLMICLFAGSMIAKYFHTTDSRQLVLTEAAIGQKFYGGKTRSQIPVEGLSVPWNGDRYWAGYRGRVGKMVEEEHWYIYKGRRDSQIEVEYTYQNARGQKGGRTFLLPLNSSYNQAELIISSIPYISKSKDVTLILSPLPGNRLRIQPKPFTPKTRRS